MPAVGRPLLVLVLCLSAPGCNRLTESPDGGGSSGDAGPLQPLSGITVAEWNLNWFGDPRSGYGPANDDLQEQNVAQVIAAHADVDLWALEEIADVARFDEVKAGLNGFAGFTATNPMVFNNTSYTGEQRVAILYRQSLFRLSAARVVLGSYSHDFAERPPLEITFDVNRGSGMTQLIVMVVHMKAYGDQSSYDRRLAAGQALKRYLDMNHPNDMVMVVGDWNDDLVNSTFSGHSSPYQELVTDTASYMFPTKAFTDHATATTVSGGLPIDHHMVTNEIAPLLISGSPQVFHPNVMDYGTTTSDHYPTQVRYQFP